MADPSNSRVKSAKKIMLYPSQSAAAEVNAIDPLFNIRFRLRILFPVDDYINNYEIETNEKRNEWN